MPIVTQYDRKWAAENQKKIVEHLLNRLWDIVSHAGEIDEPDALLTELSKVSNLAGKVQQAAGAYKGLYLDWKMNEPKTLEGTTGSVEPIPVEPGPEVAAPSEDKMPF